MSDCHIDKVEKAKDPVVANQLSLGLAVLPELAMFSPGVLWVLGLYFQRKQRPLDKQIRLVVFPVNYCYLTVYVGLFYVCLTRAVYST